MRAAVLEEIGKLNIVERPKPAPEAGWVLVAVEAAGICGSDIARVYETGAHRMPLICGHEFAGQVASLGPGVDSSWQGKKVGVFPLIPCGKCPSCKKRQYEMCDGYSYLGSRCDGGFAQFVAVPEWNLLPLPEGVALEDAAMLEPTAVAAHAIRRMNVTPEQTVAVCGLGTIGLLTVMLLKEVGVKRVLAIGNKALQQQKALELGVKSEDYLDISKIVDGAESSSAAAADSSSSSTSAWIAERTAGLGCDVFFECVGRNETINAAISSTAKGGAIMLVGNPASDMSLTKAVYWEVLRKQLTLCGTWNSSYTGQETDDWHYVLNKIAAGAISPSSLITHRFSLEQLTDGLELMRSKSEEYIKVVTYPEPPLG